MNWLTMARLRGSSEHRMPFVLYKMRGRRVLIFCDGPVVYGKEIVSLLLARELCNAGWNAQFITSKWNGSDVTAWLADSGVQCIFLWLGFISLTLRLEPLRCSFGQLTRLPHLLIGFHRLTRSRRLRAVVHTNWQHCLLLLPLLRRERDVYWAHEIPPLSKRYGYAFRAIARRAGRVVCVSQAVADRMLSLGVPAGQVVVVRNGVPSAEIAEALADGECLRLGIVGQIAAQKGHEDLIEALGLLRRDGVRASLLVFGSGAPEYLASLKERAVELDVQQQIEWRGYVADKSRIFGEIDVCMVPSRFEEPLATSAIEASGYGRPVICSSRGGLPEIVKHGETGFVVEPDCPGEIADAIRNFVKNPDLVKIMGTAAQCRARAEFSTQRFAKEFIQVLEAL
jgi:glycosyltransferase involved in cell wall biosynthesis